MKILKTKSKEKIQEYLHSAESGHHFFIGAAADVADEDDDGDNEGE